jgi:hypothetical protein
VQQARLHLVQLESAEARLHEVGGRHGASETAMSCHSHLMWLRHRAPRTMPSKPPLRLNASLVKRLPNLTRPCPQRASVRCEKASAVECTQCHWTVATDNGYERIALERLSSGRGIPWYCSEKKAHTQGCPSRCAPRAYFLPYVGALLPEKGIGQLTQIKCVTRSSRTSVMNDPGSPRHALVMNARGHLDQTMTFRLRLLDAMRLRCGQLECEQCDYGSQA